MRQRFALLAAVLLVAPVRAEAPKRDHDITVDDYFTQANIVDCVILDELHIAYTEGRWQQSTNDRKTDLWVTNRRHKPAKRLTSDRANDRSPKWFLSEEIPGRWGLYFLGNRKREGEKRPPYDGTTQVWKIPAFEESEPSAVTKVEGGVVRYDLTRDWKTLYYITETDHVADEWKNLREQFKDVEYGHGVEKVSQVWRLDIQNWRAEKIIDEKRYIHDFAVSPDGKRIAMITAPDDKVINFEGKSRVDVFNTETKKIETVPDEVFRKQAPSPYGWLEHLAWADEGIKLAFNVIFDGYPADIAVAVWRDNEIAVSKLERPKGLHVKGYGSPLGWYGGNNLAFLGEEKGRVRLYFAPWGVKQAGAVEVLTPGDVVVQNFSFPPNNRVPTNWAVVMNDATSFEDIHVFNQSQGRVSQTQVTNVNPQTATWKLPQLSTVQWKAPDGTPVEGILELPPDYKKGQKVPLVVAIHGGPTTADYFALQFWFYGRTLLPAKGYAVLCPNYRGSTGYGDKFLTDLLGRENDLDVKDILAGVDHLVKEGIADPEKLGVMGWSNGGYLTNCLITQTTRFKAASSGAGITDAVTEWGANDEPAYAIVFKKGFPWNASENYHKASPIYGLDKVRTPTLIHVGGSDERCPPSQSQMLYRALKEYDKVPAELIVYPGESHGVMKYKNRKAKMEWDLAWFERYIMGKPAKGRDTGGN
jgi:dipeptidyl aminopeptidase/acylaminoacyl peptidase